MRIGGQNYNKIISSSTKTTQQKNNKKKRERGKIEGEAPVNRKIKKKGKEKEEKKPPTFLISMFVSKIFHGKNEAKKKKERERKKKGKKEREKERKKKKQGPHNKDLTASKGCLCT